MKKIKTNLKMMAAIVACFAASMMFFACGKPDDPEKPILNNGNGKGFVIYGKWDFPLDFCSWTPGANGTGALSFNMTHFAAPIQVDFFFEGISELPKEGSYLVSSVGMYHLEYFTTYDDHQGSFIMTFRAYLDPLTQTYHYDASGVIYRRGDNGELLEPYDFYLEWDGTVFQIPAIQK